MKRMLSAVLCAATALTLLVLPAQAAEAPEMVRRVAVEMGVMDAGEANFTRPVTRGEFAKMLVSASARKGTVSPTGNASPYRDVPYTHAYASYIKTAVQEGWMTGYLDGTFHPGQAVTAAEGATALLALLGYGSGDFSGGYPDGQMALAQSLGLCDGVHAAALSGLTLSDCTYLFYNLLGAKAKGGDKKYAEVAGYKVDKDGKPDVGAMLQPATEGPFVVPAGGAQGMLPFTPAAVYRNDTAADADAIQPWDVIYYAKGSRTVWAYARKVSGTYEKAAPDKEAPEAVTVSGTEYKVGGAAAKSQLGTGSGLPIGSVVTLLLGRGGEVAAAYAAESLSTEIIGVVTAAGTSPYTSANGAPYEAATVTVLGLDGQSYTVKAAQKRSVGSLVRVSFPSGGVKIESLRQNQAVIGKVSDKGRRVGQSPAAPDIRILDVADGAAAKVYLSRLDGLTLRSEDVLYSEKNAAGEVSALILKGVTGDQYRYGVVLSAKEENDGQSLRAAYRVLVNGETTAYSLADRVLGAKPGPARIETQDGQLKRIVQLGKVDRVDSISGVTLKGAGETHTIWDNATAYIYKDQQYHKADRNELDPAVYNMKAYYDAPDSEGGRIRIIVATPR